MNLSRKCKGFNSVHKTQDISDKWPFAGPQAECMYAMHECMHICNITQCVMARYHHEVYLYYAHENSDINMVLLHSVVGVGFPSQEKWHVHVWCLVIFTSCDVVKSVWPGSLDGPLSRSYLPCINLPHRLCGRASLL